MGMEATSYYARKKRAHLIKNALWASKFCGQTPTSPFLLKRDFKKVDAANPYTVALRLHAHHDHHKIMQG